MEQQEEGNERTVILGIFGASGRTGKYIVEGALDRGWKVQALVRNPDKLQIESSSMNDLTVIKGDFATSDDAIQQTVKDATYVICCAGGPHNPKKYQKGFMTTFVQEKLWPVLQQNKPEAFLFQAGALSKLHPFPTFSQLIIAPLLGLRPMAKDNDGVMRFIHNNSLGSDTRVVCTRPGALISGKGGTKLRTSFYWPSSMPISFADLGAFTLELIMDESMDGKYPYITKKVGI